MSLPNYFLADLPPEATLSPAMITEACQTLKRNRERYLAGRSTEHLIQILSDVAEGWLQPENRFRKLALEHAGVQALACSPDTLKRELQQGGAPAPAFSRATLEKGLDNFFRQLTTENLEALLEQELGDAINVTGEAVSTHHVITRHPSLLARPGISRPYHGGQRSESGADEHRARSADPFGAVREMRAVVRRFCPGCSPTRFTRPTQSWAPAWKSPNGAVAMWIWRPHCLPRPIV